MPVRSLNSSVKKWPDRNTVIGALRSWAQKINGPDIARIGCIGSYARGDWGVGSDLDIVIILKTSCVPFHLRSSMYNTTELPVPADCMVFTQEEIKNHQSDRFKRTLLEEALWVWPD